MTAGSDKVTRRSERHPSIAARPPVGTTLREARESQGVTLAEVRDRTGVSWQHLEALEAMQLGLLPDQRTVVTAARRYAEVVGLDPSEVCGTVLRAWQDQHWGRDHIPADGSKSNDTKAVEAQSGSRERNGHLRAFTQTAEVPLSSHQRARMHGQSWVHFADTGAVPLTWARGRYSGPRTLQLTIALVGLLLLVGIAGLAIAHYEPNWLSDVHITHARSAADKTTTTRPAHHPSPTSNPRQLVSALPAANGSESVTVNSQSYQVVVTAQQPCWIDATAPSAVDAFTTGTPGAGPVGAAASERIFEGVLQSGDAKVLQPVAGKLSIEFGASLVTVQVQINGKTVPTWSFSPTKVPFTVNFASA